MLLSYLSFFTFSIFFILGIRELILDPKTELNLTFFMVSITAGFWAFSYIFIYNENSKENVWFWYRASSFGWLGCNFAVFNYLCIFSNLKKVFPKILLTIRIILFLFMSYLIFIQLTGTLFVVDFITTPFGNAEKIDMTLPGYWLFSIYTISSVVISYILLIIGNRYNNSKRYVVQSRGLILVVTTSFIFIFVFNTLLPLNGKFHFPSIGVFFTNIFIIGVLYLIQKYRFMRLDYGLLKEEMIDTISDMLVIVSSEKKLIRANLAFKKIFNINDGITIDEFLNERHRLRESLRDMDDLKIEKKLKFIIFKNDENNEMIVNATLFPIFDGFGDYAGTIIHGRIMNEYEHIMNSFKITAQEKRIIFLIMEGLLNKEIAAKMQISEVTIKNYIYNIYKKTNVANRMELLRLFFPNESLN
jgi:DNA-binding CsgD family transcriptional regulator